MTTTLRERREAALAQIEQGVNRADTNYAHDAREWSAKLYTIFALIEIGRILAGIEETLDARNAIAERGQ